MSHNGRYYIIDAKTGRKFCVEAIDNGQHPADWGDIDVVSKKLTGKYGQKHIGSIKESESIITKENGFNEIYNIEPGENPDDFVKKLLKDNR